MYENSQADWFVFAGCDTYIYTKRLQDLLQNFNQEQPLYIGSKLHSGNFANFYRTETPCKYFASGGPGLILSKNLLKKLYPVLDRCPSIWKNALNEFNEKLHPAASDVALAYILWKELNVFVTFIPDNTDFELYHCPPKDYQQITKQPVSFHYVTPKLMLRLHQNRD